MVAPAQRQAVTVRPVRYFFKPEEAAFFAEKVTAAPPAFIVAVPPARQQNRCAFIVKFCHDDRRFDVPFFAVPQTLWIYRATFTDPDGKPSVWVLRVPRTADDTAPPETVFSYQFPNLAPDTPPRVWLPFLRKSKQILRK